MVQSEDKDSFYIYHTTKTSNGSSFVHGYIVIRKTEANLKVWYIAGWDAADTWEIEDSELLTNSALTGKHIKIEKITNEYIKAESDIFEEEFNFSSYKLEYLEDPAFCYRLINTLYTVKFKKEYETKIKETLRLQRDIADRDGLLWQFQKEWYENNINKIPPDSFPTVYNDYLQELMVSLKNKEIGKKNFYDSLTNGTLPSNDQNYKRMYAAYENSFYDYRAFYVLVNNNPDLFLDRFETEVIEPKMDDNFSKDCIGNVITADEMFDLAEKLVPPDPMRLYDFPFTNYKNLMRSKFFYDSLVMGWIDADEKSLRRLTDKFHLFFTVYDAKAFVFIIDKNPVLNEGYVKWELKDLSLHRVNEVSVVEKKAIITGYIYDRDTKEPIADQTFNFWFNNPNTLSEFRLKPHTTVSGKHYSFTDYEGTYDLTLTLDCITAYDTICYHDTIIKNVVLKDGDTLHLDFYLRPYKIIKSKKQLFQEKHESYLGGFLKVGGVFSFYSRLELGLHYSFDPFKNRMSAEKFLCLTEFSFEAFIRQNVLLTPKLSLKVVPMKNNLSFDEPALFTFGLESLYYSDYHEGYFALRPVIGFNLFFVMEVFYGYDIKLTRSDTFNRFFPHVVGIMLRFI